LKTGKNQYALLVGGITTGVHPPRDLRSVTNLDAKRYKTEYSPKRRLDSAVGCNDLLGGFLQRSSISEFHPCPTAFRNLTLTMYSDCHLSIHPLASFGNNSKSGSAISASAFF